MIPEGMDQSSDRHSLPSMTWRLSEDSSPQDMKKYYYEKARNYRFKMEDLHKYSQKLRNVDLKNRFDRSAMGKVIPQT